MPCLHAFIVAKIVCDHQECVFDRIQQTNLLRRACRLCAHDCVCRVCKVFVMQSTLLSHASMCKWAVYIGAEPKVPQAAKLPALLVWVCCTAMAAL
jgi:hypothetical protein